MRGGGLLGGLIDEKFVGREEKKGKRANFLSVKKETDGRENSPHSRGHDRGNTTSTISSKRRLERKTIGQTPSGGKYRDGRRGRRLQKTFLGGIKKNLKEEIL